MSGSNQTFRPRLLWRLLVPWLAVFAALLAVQSVEADDIFIDLVALLAATVWTAYLWTARLTITSQVACLRYFGKDRSVVDLGSVRSSEVHMTAAFPWFSPQVLVRDAAGNSIMLTALYWKGWKELHRRTQGMQ